MKHQLSIRGLLGLTAFIALFVAALVGAFGSHVERAVSEFSIVVAVATGWSFVQVVFYFVIVSPLIVLWFVAQRFRRADES